MQRVPRQKTNEDLGLLNSDLSIKESRRTFYKNVICQSLPIPSKFHFIFKKKSF